MRSTVLLAGALWAALAPLAGCKLKVGGGTPADGFPCADGSECPAPDSDCLGATCLDGQCAFVPAPAAALPDGAQTAGDCKQTMCDGEGNRVSGTFSFDLPADDQNPCTEAACDRDRPLQRAKPAGAACGAEGVCNGAGKCGVCVPADRRCDGHAVATCESDGQWSRAQPCAVDKPVCSAAKCVGVVEMASGGAHGCARFEDGNVRCWGADQRGQLGSAGATAGGPPPWGSAMTAVAAGTRHACAVRSGAAWCWGANDLGQLGVGTFVSQGAPAAVQGVSGVRSVAVGEEHSCALTSAGEVFCWGRNDRGQLGSGQLGSGQRATAKLDPAPPAMRAKTRAEPAAIESLTDAGSLALGSDHTCVKRTNGAELCWGATPYALPPAIEPPPEPDPKDPKAPKPDPDELKRYQEREQATARTATKVAGLSGVTALACGAHHCCAGDAKGVKCWGAADRGQLGDGAQSDRFKPVPVVGLGPATPRLGRSFSCALAAGGKVYCWGANDRGQLGTGAAEASVAKPALLATLPQVKSLHPGEDHACALTTAGRALCWGDGAKGQLGSTKMQSARQPIPVPW